MLIDDVSEFMVSTIQIQPYTGQDEFGNPSFGTAISYQGKIEFKNRMIRNLKGQEQVSRGKIILKTQTVMSTKDKLILPAGYEPTSPEIMAVYPVQADQGIDHIVIMMG